MTLIKSWVNNSRGLAVASNDYLDEINDSMAEQERSSHELGECLEDCQHCQLDRDMNAEAERRKRADSLWNTITAIATADIRYKKLFRGEL